MSVFGWSYPPGAENDPYAPYNQTDEDDIEPVDGHINDDLEFCEHVCAETTEQAIRHVYKFTDCGAWLVFEENGIHVGSIVEGSDFGCMSYRIPYPFLAKLYDRVVDAIEKEADAIWIWANERDDADMTSADYGCDLPDVYLDYPDLSQYATASSRFFL